MKKNYKTSLAEREYARKYRMNHYEKIRENDKIYKLNHKEQTKQYRLKNKEYFLEQAKKSYHKNKQQNKENGLDYYSRNKESRKKRNAEWLLNHLEWKKEWSRKYCLKNKEKRKTYKKKYDLEHGEMRRKYYKIRKKTDPMYNMKLSLRGRMGALFNSMKINKPAKTVVLLGAGYDVVKRHIECQFRENMSWGNYGFRGWHIDHIIPLSSAKDLDELIALCHYSNLQPLWAKENLEKSSKIIKSILCSSS